MLDQTRCITLLPLRLEIRYVSEEYWIRWYPDDLSLFVPAKVITKEEGDSFSDLIKFCDLQKTALNESLARCATDFIQSVDRSEQDPEKLLEIYNGLEEGKLTEEQKKLCARYNQKALFFLNESYAKQTTIHPEQRWIGLRLGWKKIYDLENPAIQWAWHRFADKVGIVRARYIASATLSPEFIPPVYKTDPMKEVLDKGVKVAMMPPWIQLFVFIKDETGERVVPLREPIAITSAQLRVGVQQSDETLWMTDFNQAIQKGMGVKITETAQITLIKQASWLICVGVEDPENVAFSYGSPIKRFQNILMALRSRGELAIIPQDAPTNNTDSKNSAYSSHPNDLKEYIQRSLRKNGLSNDAALLSNALQLNHSVLSEISGVDLEEQSQAKAMGQLLWRSSTQLAKGFFNATPSGWDQLEGVFAEFVRARGPLPILAAGKNPYGVLPIMDVRDWKFYERQNSSNTESNTETIAELKALMESIKMASQFFLQEMEGLTNQIPTLGMASEEKQYETLLEILRLHSVSKEVFQRVIKKNGTTWNIHEDSRHILGPLVKDIPSAESHSGLEYLKAIAYGEYKTETRRIECQSAGTLCVFEPLDRIKDYESVKYSLLHKLLSVYIYSAFSEETERSKQEEELKKRLNNLKSSALQLLDISVNKLETLFMEIFDLLTFRIDAWMTAFATKRMNECFKVPDRKEMGYGAYGWLENPGNIRTIQDTSEYIQAPSFAQAATGALLRSGARSQAEEGGASPYQTHLDSKRVAKGMLLLDQLRRGYPIGEILGYQLERLIHDNAARNAGLSDKDVYHLRDLFRLPHQTNNEVADGRETAYASLIDGKKFVDSFDKVVGMSWVTDNKLEQLKIYKDHLQDSVDSAADIAVSELIYQFIKGNTARAGAWMDFVEGEILPPEVEFVQTPRSGKMRKTQFFLSLPDQSESEQSSAKIFDPVLDAFCASRLPNWDREKIQVQIQRGEQTATCVLALQNPQEPVSLNISPSQYIWGGDEELFYRIRCAVVYLWKQGKLPSLGPAPEEISPTQLEINVIETTPSLKLAEAIKRSLSLNRKNDHLSPFDNPLPLAFKQREITFDWDQTSDRLEKRYGLLSASLKRLRDQIAGLTFQEEEELSDEARKALLAVYENPFAPNSLPQQLAQFGFMEALNVMNSAENIQTTLRNILNQIHKRVDLKVDQLTGEKRVAAWIEILANTIGKKDAVPLLPLYLPNKASWNVQFNYHVDQLLEELQVILVKKELPPDFKYGMDRISEKVKDILKSEVKFDSSFDVAKYAEINPALKDIKEVFNGYHSYFHGFATVNEVYYTSEETGNQKSLIFLPLYQLDELLPNASETTALAVRYSTPKTQAPNAILIAAPPEIKSEPWSAQKLANALSETLKLMKLRMIATDQVIGHPNLGKSFPICFPHNGEGFLATNRNLFAGEIAESFHYNVLNNEPDFSPPPVTAARED